MVALVVVLAIVALVAIGVAVWLYTTRRRSTHLKEQFGPEYDRAVQDYGGQKEAEQRLEARKQQVERFNIRPLSTDEYSRFNDAWKSAQARFVDDPPGAIRDADTLIADVMRTRGYPVGDFESRAADLSVSYPNVVSNYRSARTIAMLNEQGQASTEDLRKAMVHYRALFQELLETKQPSLEEAKR